MPETTIRLRNSLTRKVEPFEPIDPRNVRMYVCGPTVYDRAHLGNARSAVVFDVLFRLLRHVYGENHVTYVRNVTDIDDKIIARARETGRSVEDVTEETTRWYHEDMDALGCLRPTKAIRSNGLPQMIEPRATDYVTRMVAMIRALIERGHAYEAQGHVLFSVASYDAYGRLSGRSVEDMIAGARVEVAPYKRDAMDFVLWKPSEVGVPGWDSPWGRGRPGWHIECSAMARDLLGGAFDIHGGGLDLQFPHHENEIAQSACVGDSLARVWVHNEMLMVDGRKMSKSLGNFFTVRDLLDQGVPGEVIRLVLLGSHYGRPMDWTERKVEEARGTLTRWRRMTEGTGPGAADDRFAALLADDLNTPGAVARLHELASEGAAAALASSAGVLGLLAEEMADWDWPPKSQVISLESGGAEAGGGEVHVTAGPSDLPPIVGDLVLARREAKAARDFARADAIRDALTAAGVVIRDTPQGTEIERGSGFDPAKLEAIE